MNEDRILRRLDGLAADVRRTRASTARLELLVRTCIAGKVDCEARCKANQHTLHGNGDVGLKSRVHSVSRLLGVLVGLLVCLLGTLVAVIAAR